MGSEITSVQQFNSVGAALLPKYGKDNNDDHEIAFNEAEGLLTLDEFSFIASAGDDDPSTISYLDVLTYEGYKISKAVLDQVRLMRLMPEMIALFDKLSIMKGEVTVGLFKQVMQGYKITGHNTDELQAILTDPKQENDALTCVSLLDVREFAKRLSAQTGRKFRVQTEAEWQWVNDQLSGINWTWTETKYSKNTFVLRRLGNDFRNDFTPNNRFSNSAVRLVEDK